MSYSDSLLDFSSLNLQAGKVNKKTINVIAGVAGAVLFVASVLIIIVWAVKPSTQTGSGAARAKSSASRMAVDLESEQHARNALAGETPAMVFIYADWCGFCKRADPIYTELAQDPAYSHIKLLKLNSTKASSLVQERGIRGFPVFLTNWGEQIVGFKPKEDMSALLRQAPKGKLRAARTCGNMAHPLGAAMAQQRGALVMEEALVTQALGEETPAVVFVSADWCGFCKKLKPIWDEVASSGKFNHINMMQIDAKNAPGIIKKHGITGFPVLLSNSGSKKYVGYRPKEKLEEILVEIGGDARGNGAVRMQKPCPVHKYVH